MQQSNKFVGILGLSCFLLIISLSVISSAPVGFSEISVDSNCPSNICPFFNKPSGVWVFEWTDDGFTTDKVLASFSPSDLKGMSGVETSQNFEISISGTKNNCEYGIHRESDRLDVFSVDIVTKEESFWAWEYDEQGLRSKAIEFESNLNCISVDGETVSNRALVTGITKDKVYVVCPQQRDLLGKVGSIQTPKITTETAWVLRADGKSDILQTVSNAGIESGRTTQLGSNALIQWQGILSSGEQCPVATQELALYSSSFSGNWKIISQSNYDTYENFMGIANLDSLMAQIACGDVSEFTGCTQLSKEVVEQRINSKASVAINERDFGETIVTDTSINNGKLLSTLNKQIAFPKFRLFVDSDYLTLSIPTGEPDVTCPSTVKFAEGEQGQITVSAKNLGENEGGFNLKVLSCDGNFAEGDTAGITLNGGETKSVTLKTTAQTQLGQTVSGSCVIEMKESTTQKVDTCSVNLEATAPLECTIGRVWCSYDGTFSVIKNCPEGTPQILTKCTSTQSCDIDSQGIPFCKSLGGNNGSNNEQTCNALATSQPYLGWVWAESSSEVGDGPFGIGKIIGLTHTETEGKCEPTFAVYYMIGVVLIVMIISILFLMRSPKPQQYQPRPRQQYAPRNY